MNLRKIRARERRIAQLRAAAPLSDANHAELRRLENQHDCFWRSLPRRIAARRDDLARLTAYADEIGLGPV